MAFWDDLLAVGIIGGFVLLVWSKFTGKPIGEIIHSISAWFNDEEEE